MKTLAAVLFTKIREIEKAKAEAELRKETEEKVTIKQYDFTNRKCPLNYL